MGTSQGPVRVLNAPYIQPPILYVHQKKGSTSYNKLNSHRLLEFLNRKIERV